MSAGGLRDMADLLADVSRETRRQLEVLVETLERWQKAINLVGKTTLDGVWKRHILDSAQVVPLIPAEAKTLADLGSGGGFPGLVICCDATGYRGYPDRIGCPESRLSGRSRAQDGAGAPAKARDQADRGGAAGQRRGGDREGPGAAEPVAGMVRPTQDEYRYLSFPQGEGLAGRGGRGQEEVGLFP